MSFPAIARLSRTLEATSDPAAFAALDEAQRALVVMTAQRNALLDAAISAYSLAGQAAERAQGGDVVGAVAELAEAQGLIREMLDLTDVHLASEVIHWHAPAVAMPEISLNVLLQIEDTDGRWVTVSGYLAAAGMDGVGPVWSMANGDLLAASPELWAHMPEGPWQGAL